MDINAEIGLNPVFTGPDETPVSKFHYAGVAGSDGPKTGVIANMRDTHMIFQEKIQDGFPMGRTEVPASNLYIVLQHILSLPVLQFMGHSPHEV
jgi:hypothetical protein